MVASTLLRSSLRVSKVARPALVASSTASGSSSAARQLHSLPPPSELLENGCAPFLSANTVKQVSQEWQSGLLELLNQEVRDTEYASSSIVETVIGLSQNREKILAFNYASQALNNSFFFSSLAPQDRLKNSTPLPHLSAAISKSFGSFPELCIAFCSAAYGMSSSGWVWIVTDQHQNLGVVPTYGAGTVIVQNRVQHGQKFMLPSIQDDKKAQGEPDQAAKPEKPIRPASAVVGSSGNAMGISSMTDSVGNALYPLLNLSVHEHAWLNDYGIMGKEEYLTRFWNCVNWDKVEERFVAYCPPQSRGL